MRRPFASRLTLLSLVGPISMHLQEPEITYNRVTDRNSTFSEVSWFQCMVKAPSSSNGTGKVIEETEQISARRRFI